MKFKNLMIAVAALALASCCEKAPQKTIELPFQGNTYVTQVEEPFIENASRVIDTRSGLLKDWSCAETVISLYFKTSVAGSFDLSVRAANPEGTEASQLSFSYGGKTRKVEVAGSEMTDYKVGKFKVAEPGYVKIDIQGVGVTPEGAQFARIENFNVTGTAVADTCNYVPTAKIKDNYWFRRGPSVHFGYTQPEGDVEYFYNEVTVSEGQDVPCTYFMLTGFAQGYMGIQSLPGGRRSVLFSVWSPYTTDDPREIPEEDRVVCLRKGADVTVRDFGNEGSGGQSFSNYPWKTGETYKTLVQVTPDGKGRTVYTGYFCDEKGEWHLIASFRRPKTDTWYRGAHSFLECFRPETSYMSREVRFKNQWARMADGTWVEVTKGTFTCDGTGRSGMRGDMYGALENGEFVLKNCGFFPEHQEYGTKFEREANGVAPEIDFEALKKL